MAAAAPASAAPASTERYEDGLAAYQRNEFDKSLKLLRPLAEKGDARAQYLLGRHYQFGQAVKADRAEAFFWYKRAEAKGHLEAKLFRQLLDKRWKITADERGRAERRLAVQNAPKPANAAPSNGDTAQKSKPDKPKPEKPIEAAALKEKAKPAASLAEGAKPEPVKPAAAKVEKVEKSAVEVARAKLLEPPKPEPAKAKTESAKPKPPDKPAVVAARSTPGPEPSAPTVLQGKTDTARGTPRPPMREDDDDDDTAAPRHNDTPPPETRTPVAAAPTRPPPTDDHAPYPSPNHGPQAPRYAPGVPYYTPGVPYYAPAAPPSWRGSIYYGPHYRPQPHWGYRPYAGYMHPGWRGMGWRGHRGRW